MKNRVAAAPGHVIKRARDVFALLRARAYGLDRECFWRLDLDARGQLLNCELVSIGTLDASIAHPREIFKGALQHSAFKIIVAHNHPSQDVRPSDQDRETTLRLALCCVLLGIDLADHVILSDERYYSFKESGRLPI